MPQTDTRRSPPRGRRDHSHGFTLLEITVIVALGVLFLAISFNALLSGRARGGPRAVAMQLLADLRWAQQRAVTQGRPWGLLLPNGVLGQSYAIVGSDMNAPARMTVQRRVDGFEEFPAPVIFSGTWPEQPFAPPAEAEAWGAPDAVAASVVGQWLQPWPGRYVMFSASGALTAPALSHVAGQRFLVVSAGAVVDGDVLRETGPAYTIRISPLGEMSLESGIPGRVDASTASSLSRVASLPADLPQASTPTVNPPSDVALDVRPFPNPLTLPGNAASGQTFQVRLDGTLSLTVSASTQGESRPTVAWGEHALSPPGPGLAPQPDPASMCDADPGTGHWSTRGSPTTSWDEAESRWTQSIEWQPPADAAPGQWYGVGAVMETPGGRKRAAWVAVQIIEAGATRLAWSEAGAADGGPPHTYVGTVAGTEATAIPGHRGARPLAYGPDGAHLLLASQGTLCGVSTETLESDETPSGGMQVGAQPVVTLSPLGHRLAWLENAGPDGIAPLHVANLDGSGHVQLSDVGEAPGWGPDGRLGYVVHRSLQQPFTHSLYVYDPRHPGAQTWVSPMCHGFATLWFPTADPARIIALHDYAPENLGLAALLLPHDPGMAIHFFPEPAPIPPDQTPPSKANWQVKGPISEIIANVVYEPHASCGQAQHCRFSWSPDNQMLAYNYVRAGDATPCLTYVSASAGAQSRASVFTSEPTQIAGCYTHLWSRDSTSLLTMQGTPGSFSAVVINTRTGARQRLLDGVSWVVWAP